MAAASGLAVDVSSKRRASHTAEIVEAVQSMLPPETVPEEPMPFDVLKVAPDDLAKQITLLDSNVFRKIKPDELKGSVWLAKDKFQRAPNVVDFTRRFNHVSFWVTREVLQAPSQAVRVDRLIHFIKLAKRLFECNNLHGLLAVLSGLQSAPIYRLSQTWKCLGEKYVQRFERFEKLMSEADNYKNLREYLASARLPCIPYLGMYLTDLVHVQSHGRLPPAEAEKRTYSIIEDVLRFQHSEYSFDVVGFIREYLLSVRYSEELLKLIESENYRLSLAIEPKHDGLTKGPTGSTLIADTILERMTLAPPKGSVPTRLRPARHGHRKVKSLGSGAIFASVPSQEALLCPPEDTIHSASPSRAWSQEDKEVLVTSPGPPSPPRSPKTSPSKGDSASEGSDEEDLDFSFQSVANQDIELPVRIERESMLRRRTSSKLFPIKRQWVLLSSPHLYLFSSARHGSRSERSSYKSTPSCVLSIEHSAVEVPQPAKPEFRLTLQDERTCLRFIADSLEERERWVRALQHAAEHPTHSARPSLVAGLPASPQTAFQRTLSHNVT